MPEHDIQRKATGANQFFESGLPVPAVVHASDESNEFLVDLLLESGIQDLATAEKVADSFNEKLTERFTELAEEKVVQLAKEKLRSIALALVGSTFDKTPSGRAFRRVVLGDYGRSFADDATDCRCTAPAIHYHQKHITERVSHLMKRLPPRISDEAV